MCDSCMTNAQPAVAFGHKSSTQAPAARNLHPVRAGDNSQLRGRVHGVPWAVRLLTDTVSPLRRAGTGVQPEIRADKALCINPLLSTAEKFDVRFSVAARPAPEGPRDGGQHRGRGVATDYVLASHSGGPRRRHRRSATGPTGTGRRNPTKPPHDRHRSRPASG